MSQGEHGRVIKATAFIVGADSGPGAVLFSLAQGFGFSAVMPFREMGAVEKQFERTPLCFFLFAGSTDVAALRATTRTLRHAGDRRLIFSPQIYFTENPGLDLIRMAIGLGFDDIISLPIAPARVEERLRRQVNRPIVYFETASYIGPDRRTRQIPNDPGHKLRGTGGWHRRIEFTRSFDHGMALLRNEVFEN